jgi:hypothetical protein
MRVWLLDEAAPSFLLFSRYFTVEVWIVKHSGMVTFYACTGYKGICSCGWKGKDLSVQKNAAMELKAHLHPKASTRIVA